MAYCSLLRQPVAPAAVAAAATSRPARPPGLWPPAACGCSSSACPIEATLWVSLHSFILSAPDAAGIILSLILVGMACATAAEGRSGLGFCGPILSFVVRERAGSFSFSGGGWGASWDEAEGGLGFCSSIPSFVVRELGVAEAGELGRGPAGSGAEGCSRGHAGSHPYLGPAAGALRDN